MRLPVWGLLAGVEQIKMIKCGRVSNALNTMHPSPTHIRPRVFARLLICLGYPLNNYLVWPTKVFFRVLVHQLTLPWLATLLESEYLLTLDPHPKRQ